jgi:hypothetical protein
MASTPAPTAIVGSSRRRSAVAAGTRNAAPASTTASSPMYGAAAEEIAPSIAAHATATSATIPSGRSLPTSSRPRAAAVRNAVAAASSLIEPCSAYW